MAKKRRKYDKEFKLNAVKLLLQSDRTQSEIGDDLGIRSDLLSRWKIEYEKKDIAAFPGKGNQSDDQSEIKKLKKELLETKLERDILKKAVAIFSKK